jgi:predicted RNase H-like HicB family nuclease
MTARDYLNKPYERRLTPDEDGGYVATIQEFPGLVAEGETAEEAISNLESAAESWIEAVLESGQEIPEPTTFSGFSGKIALRLPRGLHRRAVEMANSEGTSLNQWLVSAIANYLGGMEAMREVASRVSVQPRLIFTANNAFTINLATGPVIVATEFHRYGQLGMVASGATTSPGNVALFSVPASQAALGDLSWPKLPNTFFRIEN